jgi:hypothetical protein
LVVIAVLTVVGLFFIGPIAIAVGIASVCSLGNIEYADKMVLSREHRA